jgi:hypothetical protein
VKSAKIEGFVLEAALFHDKVDDDGLRKRPMLAQSSFILAA